MNVKFIGALRHIAGGSKTVTIADTCSNFTVKDLIQQIVLDVPALKTDIIIQQTNGSVKTNALILINDREISVLNGVDTLLANGDEIIFIPVVHGG